MDEEKIGTKTPEISPEERKVTMKKRFWGLLIGLDIAVAALLLYEIISLFVG